MVDTLWDTGCHSSVVNQDLISDAFVDALRRTSVVTSDGALVLALAILSKSMSDATLEIETPIEIRPASQLPNGFSGVIVGQNRVINRLVYEQWPRAILEAMGETIEQDV